jgi:hypothetical protein
VIPAIAEWGFDVVALISFIISLAVDFYRAT